METGKLINTIKQDAINKGLCRLWQRKFKQGLEIKNLAEMFIKGIDFCICENFPTVEFLEENFKDKCELYGVFVNDHNVMCRDMPDVVLNGECKAILEYNSYSVSRLYIRHNSEAHIKASDHAYVTVDAFNNSKLVIDTTDSKAVVLINLYGDSHVECIGMGIKVRFMNKEIY
ncbi:MAG: hypothetical protein LBH34_02680 [Prevotellaceae bacterium]|jgi:hypothetical protein|nr:hypothetical protein [Prevotellaceae bacterium]